MPAQAEIASIPKEGECMLPTDQKERYEAFCVATEDSAILAPKTTVMIQRAASMVAGGTP